MEEKIFTIPLRKAFRVPRPKRANKAISIIREFLQRHMKTKEIVLGQSINQAIWARGIQKPPRRVRVHATIHEGKAYAELLGVDFKFPEKKEAKKEKVKEKSKSEGEESAEKEKDKSENIVEKESKDEREDSN